MNVFLWHRLKPSNIKLIIYKNLSAEKSFRLETVGVLQKPKQVENYSVGQLILHRLFGYRGCILSCWPGKLFDKDIISQKSSTYSKNVNTKKEEGESFLFYQVLADARDLVYATNVREGITFLPDGNKVTGTIFIIPGMDYMTQDDIIPYTTREKNPIDNDYFRNFLRYDHEKEPCWLPTPDLTQWLQDRKTILELSTVHRETTEKIRVTVIPFYMGARQLPENEEDMVRYWRYMIRLENLSGHRVQLRERFWKVFSVSGSLESVKGKGVVGQQPILTKASPVFQYHSHVQLQAPWGHMWGSYKFERENGSTFDVKIPAFPLCGRTDDIKPPPSDLTEH